MLATGGLRQCKAPASFYSPVLNMRKLELFRFWVCSTDTSQLLSGRAEPIIFICFQFCWWGSSVFKAAWTRLRMNIVSICSRSSAPRSWNLLVTSSSVSSCAHSLDQPSMTNKVTSKQLTIQHWSPSCHLLSLHHLPGHIGLLLHPRILWSFCAPAISTTSQGSLSWLIIQLMELLTILSPTSPFCVLVCARL